LDFKEALNASTTIEILQSKEIVPRYKVNALAEQDRKKEYYFVKIPRKDRLSRREADYAREERHDAKLEIKANAIGEAKEALLKRLDERRNIREKNRSPRPIVDTSKQR